jgi:hypothetical protein
VKSSIVLLLPLQPLPATARNKEWFGLWPIYYPRGSETNTVSQIAGSEKKRGGDLMRDQFKGGASAAFS